MSGLDPARRAELRQALVEGGGYVERHVDRLAPLIARWLTEAWGEGWSSAHFAAESWCARSRPCVEESPDHNPYLNAVAEETP